MNPQHLPDPGYLRAMGREDLSQFVFHLTDGKLGTGQRVHPLDIVRQMLSQGLVLASMRSSITKYHPLGAVCLYDVPPWLLARLVATNPNDRKGYGLMVAKPTIWSIGERQAIYAENSDGGPWPAEERFRMVRTDLGSPWDARRLDA